MMRSGGTPNLVATPASSSVSALMVLTSVTWSLTSCAMSLSPVETMLRIPFCVACCTRVPITSSASTPSMMTSGQPSARISVVQRLDLAAQVVRHRGAVSLVVGIEIVAEGLALRVEHAGDIIGRIILLQPAQHGEHAVDRVGRFACRVAQIGQRVKRAIQVGRAVHQ